MEAKRLLSMDITKKGLKDINVKIVRDYLTTSQIRYLKDIGFPINEMMYILVNMSNKSTKEISEELGWDKKAVLNFVHEVQEISGKLSPTLEDIIEIDEIYVHASDKGLKKES